MLDVHLSLLNARKIIKKRPSVCLLETKILQSVEAIQKGYHRDRQIPKINGILEGDQEVIKDEDHEKVDERAYTLPRSEVFNLVRVKALYVPHYCALAQRSSHPREPERGKRQHNQREVVVLGVIIIPVIPVVVKVIECCETDDE